MTTPQFPIKLEKTYRTEGSSEEELSPPSGLCFTSEGHLLLADDFNHRIQVYDTQFQLLHSFGSKGKEPGQFQYPKGIAVDSGGNIYVADCWNHRVQKFDSQGTLLLTFGTCGDAKGEMNEPYDILIEPSGNIIVVERYNHRIQFFDPQGMSLGWVGDRGTVFEEQLAEIQGTPANLLSPPLLELPTSIAQDSQGNYFITDSGNHRVRKFNTQWQEVLTFGEMGSEPGQFQYPLCVSIAPNDLVYVADLNNERIQVFSPFGQFLFCIDKENSDQTFEAPCLTAIDLKGCLYIGFTFNTQILKYLIPLVSQNTLAESLGTLSNPDPAHIFYQALSLEQGGDSSKALIALEETLSLLNNIAPDTPCELRMEASLQLGRLSSNGITDVSLDLACQEAEKELKTCRDNELKSFESWQNATSKFTVLLHEEQKRFVKDPNGIRDFNRDLHLAEQEEKSIYLINRGETYNHRKTVQQFSQFICNLIESGLTKTQLQRTHEVLLRQIGDTVNLMKDYFGKKEKSEESMVQILGESQGEKDKLSAFLNQYYSNGRIMDLQQQLLFELRSHWYNLRALAQKTSVNVCLEHFAGKKPGDASAFEDSLKNLIGFHEDWVAYPPFEQQFLISLDTLLRSPSSNKAGRKIDLTLSDLVPISYDSENLDFSGTLQALKAEGASLCRNDEKLLWGNDEYQFSGLSQSKEEIAHCALKLIETEVAYKEKAQELIQQLEDMLRQRKDLDSQIKQTNVEDKVSPISINDNIAIVQFQINLIRRMIMSLDINQSLNLHRLILAGAFLSLTDQKSETPEVSKFFQVFNDTCSQLTQQICKLSQSKKKTVFHIADLNRQLDELNSKYEISEISDSIELENRVTQESINRDRFEFEHQRNSRIKNIMDKLVEFRDSLTLQGNAQKTKFREIRVLEKSHTEIGKGLSPHGIQHNRNGDLLVVDFDSHRVYSYSPEGKYQFDFGGWGNTPDKLKYPNNLAIDSTGSIYVTEERTQRIKKFDKNGNFLLQFGLDQSGMLFSPSIDGQDNIWIADPEHNRIGIIDSQGNTLKILQGENANLREPVSIYCLPEGEYLVGERSESLLKHFDAHGSLIREIGRNDLGVDEIYFLAWHPSLGIFGTDSWNNQIIHLNDQFEVQSIYHKPGRRAGQLGKVTGLSIFNDQLAVANYEGSKVQIFDLSSP